jgi:hypothetical protein
MSLTKPALTAVSGGTKIGAFKIGVGRVERHQLQHHAAGPAKAVLSWILEPFAASARDYDIAGFANVLDPMSHSR